MPRLLSKVGVHRTRRSVTVGPWQIEPTPYDSGPTWQDHLATREDLDLYSRVYVVGDGAALVGGARSAHGDDVDLDPGRLRHPTSAAADWHDRGHGNGCAPS